jgi:cysteinyl-tRNA synthetase
MQIFSFFKKQQSNLPTLQFHNTLSGKLETFSPLSKREVKMYNCGPTVYDKVHIGNLRSYVFADTIRRTLDAWGYKVKQVINITDFGHLVSDGDEGEDKMTKGLKREGLTLTLPNMRMLAERYTQYFFEDIAAVGINTKRIIFPRASDYIPQQVALIKALEQKGYAYKTSDGVYFNTAKFPQYGKLGNINLSGQEAGARIENNPEKKNPNDFALWKFDKNLGWESPWGKGFPGWHIECTAMIFTLLGKQIDIHTGGIDHIPVHHNNEIAQAEAVTGKQYVQYWMHNEFITIDAKRIGKSVGNMIHLQGVVDRGYSARALRYWFLTGHYRSPMNFTWDAIEGADQALKRLTRIYLEKSDKEEEASTSNAFLSDFYKAVANDLNTPQAIALMWEKIKELDKQTLRKVDVLLGLGFSDPQEAVKVAVIEEKDLPEDVQKLLNEREESRKEKNFARSDELRKEIEDKGFEVKDTPEGAKVTKK